jgi:hypothetical protein
MKCVSLWREWEDREPNNPLVLQTQLRMKQYSKEDWSLMSGEAVKLMEDMAYIVNNNLGELPESIFDRICNHYDTWFYKITRGSVNRLAAAYAGSDKYIEFLNQYADGLNLYMYRMTRKYAHKVPE